MEKDGIIILTPSVAATEIEAKALKEGKDAVQQIRFMLERSVVAAIDVSIARRAAREKVQHKLGTIDALVYAGSLENKAALVTGDAHLTRLDDVVDFGRL